MNPVYNAFVYLVWFVATYYVVLLTLILVSNRHKLFENRKPLGRKPFVSLIVPAFNEEEYIEHTIASLKKVTYKKIEFIVISDGSTDRTSEIIKKRIKGDKRFRFLDNTMNKGKANCLNEGIDLAKGEFVACMDADSMIDANIFEKVLPYFADKKMGCVTVSVEVANKQKFLNKIFDLEFIIGLSLFLKVFSFFDSVFVTPGPFSIYRTKAMKHIGKFDPNNITEDLEIAYRLQKYGYRIGNCLEARVKAFMPETFKGSFVQRRRWYSGALQTLYQHRKMMFSKKYGYFGLFIPVNYVLIASGMLVFFMTTYLAVKKIWEDVWSLQYSGFNIFERISEMSFDILRMGQVNLLGLTALSLTILVMVAGLYFTHRRMGKRKLGMLGYPLLFFLYQIYWIGAIIAVIRGKKIAWR